MNRITFGKKNLNKQRPQVDRFITPREYLPELCRKMRWGIPDKGTDDIWYMKYLQQKKYVKYLDSAFGLEPINPETSLQPEGEEGVKLWPCTPRKKSYLSSAESILDLPTYSYSAFPELLDWSNDNVLVAALGNSYHKWSWRTQSLLSQGFTDFDIQCCKFDPKGKLLVLGTKMKTVEVHNTELNKRVRESNCRCRHISPPDYCTITALDWSPTGSSFVTGCSRGTLMSYTRDANVISYSTVVRGAILMTRVSPDARYVTATSVNDGDVLIFTWPMLQLFSSLKSDWTIKAVAWHPWRSALLGIGAVNYAFSARVALWDAPSDKLRKRSLGRDNHSLDAMLFSKKTGELVLSLWDIDTELSIPSICSQLVVMSDPDTVVDQWGKGRAGLDRVRTMVFSPDGTKLATATVGEDLIIWNFLPEDKQKKKKYCRPFSAIPVFLDKTSNGFSYR